MSFIMVGGRIINLNRVEEFYPDRKTKNAIVRYTPSFGYNVNCYYMWERSLPVTLPEVMEQIAKLQTGVGSKGTPVSSPEAESQEEQEMKEGLEESSHRTNMAAPDEEDEGLTMGDVALAVVVLDSLQGSSDDGNDD